MAVSEGGPADQTDWNLVFEDDFEAGTLDTSKWTVGFGWGLETNASPEHIVHENVTIQDGKLRLAGTHDGSDYMAGAVNTKEKAYFGPGSYWEAKLKMPKRVGFLPAFWSKPNDESWPPEIDFVELFQTDGTASDVTHSHHHIHYPTSTIKGDSSTHRDIGASYDAGVDLTDDFHIYGCQWMDDRVVHYVDGVKVAETTDGTTMEALANGAPFYMMLNIHIDRIGTADPSESWGEELVAEWVRVWEYAPNSGPVDTEPVVEATDATDITHESAQISGQLADLGGADSAVVRFQYRPTGESTWRATSDQSRSETGPFTATVTELESTREYEFRAVVDASDGDTATSGIQTFTTGSSDGSPTIDSVDITTTQQLGDEQMFTVKWAVSDPNGDLDTVEVVVVEGYSLNFAVTDVDGATASGWDLFQFPIDEEYDVFVKVTDDNGTETKEKRVLSL